MKQFKDLEFKKHPVSPDGVQSVMTFDNEYGVSVIQGESFYSDGKTTYELAPLGPGGHLDTDLSDGDVVGWLTEGEVTYWMKKLQKLKKVLD